MYPENLKGTRAIVGYMNMGYDIYPTLPELELATCPVTCGRPLHQATMTDNVVAW